MLRDHAEELHVTAPRAAIQATLDATREQLRERSARVVVADVLRAEHEPSFSVEDENLIGHKLPTATRRVAPGCTSSFATSAGRSCSPPATPMAGGVS